MSIENIMRQLFLILVVAALSTTVRAQVAGLGHGGTGQSTWTASRCVHVNAGNTALESMSGDCVTGTAMQITVNGGSALSPPVNFQNGGAVNGITINFSNPSGSNVQAAISGTMTNAGLANSSVTVSTTSPLGGGGALSLGGSLSLTCTGCLADFGQADATGKTADIAATTLLATGTSPGAGAYLITMYVEVTTVATVSSTMPTGCITWTDQDNASTTQGFNLTASSMGNALTTFSQGTMVINAKASTNIQYATGANCTGGTTYSSTAAGMQYVLRARAIKL